VPALRLALCWSWKRKPPMELIETLRNIAIREGFAAGRSIREVSEETGLSIVEVVQREIDLNLIPANEAPWRLHPGPH
jgi:hypothetical protein